MGSRHPPGHGMATDTGESLPAILPTSVWFLTTPLLSVIWKICGFPVTGIACLQALTPDNHFSRRSYACLSLLLFRNLGLKSTVLPVTLGTNRAKLLSKTMGPMALVASAAQCEDSSSPISKLLGLSAPHTWHITGWVRVLIFSLLLIIINCNLGRERECWFNVLPRAKVRES